MTQPYKQCIISGNQIGLFAPTKNQKHAIKMTTLNGQVYARSFSIFEDLPYSAQKFFPTLQDFIKGIETLLSQKNPSQLISLGDNYTLNLKLKVSMGKYEIYHHIKIQLYPQIHQFEILTQKFNQMEKRMLEFMNGIQKQKKKEINQKNDSFSIEDLSKKKLKEDKKAEKETQKQKEKNNAKQSSKSFVNSIPLNKPFKVEEKKVTITDPSHKIEACLISKEGINVISVSVSIIKTKLTYVGELNDNEIHQFLFEATKIKNAIGLFDQIKRNALKENIQTLKINQKQSKLQILINIPSSKDKFQISSNEKEETIFAEIDIKPIKQQHCQQKQVQRSVSPKSTNKKALETSKQFDKKSSRSYSQPLTKQSIISNVKQTLLGTTKGKKKDVKDLNHTSFDNISKSVSKRKSKQKDDSDKLSEISFKTKNTVQKLKDTKQVKESKSKKKNNSFNNSSDNDFSLSFSYPTRPKTKK